MVSHVTERDWYESIYVDRISVYLSFARSSDLSSYKQQHSFCQIEASLPRADFRESGRTNMTGTLTGKVAIVTGGGSGFGAGIARRFIADGAKVLIMDVNERDARRVADEIKQNGGSAASIRGDVSLKADWEAALQAALAEFGVLHIVVNNAGVLHSAQPSTDLNEEEYDRIMGVNVKQLFWSTKVIVPYFTTKKQPGLFINISSMSATRPRPNLVWYAASKGAMNSVSFSSFR